MADKFRRFKVPRHVRIYHRLMQSEAWRSLSGSAVKVLLVMASLEKGDNNGEFFLSARKGAELTGLGKNAVNRAFHELMEKGFIYCTERGAFSRKTPHAACWGLTWQAGPKGSEHRVPSHAYAKWRAKEKCGPLKEDAPVPETRTVTPEAPPDRPQNGDSEKQETAEISQTGAVPKSGTHNSNQGVGSYTEAAAPSVVPCLGWWQPDWRPSIRRITYAAILSDLLAQRVAEKRLAA